MIIKLSSFASATVMCVVPPFLYFVVITTYNHLPKHFTIIYVRKSDVTPGIRCYERNNDVTTSIFVYMEYIFPTTTLITYNFSPKPSPNILPLGGDTPFHLISRRN